MVGSSTGKGLGTSRSHERGAHPLLTRKAAPPRTANSTAAGRGRYPGGGAMSDVGEVTRILAELGRGDRSAADRLMPLLYQELRALAARYMRREPRSHTWRTTDLVHEAYLKLIDQQHAVVSDREHF